MRFCGRCSDGHRTGWGFAGKQATLPVCWVHGEEWVREPVQWSRWGCDQEGKLGSVFSRKRASFWKQ